MSCHPQRLLPVLLTLAVLMSATPSPGFGQATGPAAPRLASAPSALAAVQPAAPAQPAPSQQSLQPEAQNHHRRNVIIIAAAMAAGALVLFFTLHHSRNGCDNNLSVEGRRLAPPCT